MVCWLVVLSSRRAVSVLWGVSACAVCAAVASSGDHGASSGAGGAISSSAGRDACRCTGGEFNKSVVWWLVGLSSRRAVSVLWGSAQPADRGVKWGSRRLEMRMKYPWSSRTSMSPLSCAFLANARGEPLHFEPS